jgi:hypothetical protein
MRNKRMRVSPYECLNVLPLKKSDCQRWMTPSAAIPILRWLTAIAAPSNFQSVGFLAKTSTARDTADRSEYKKGRRLQSLRFS